MGKNILIVDDDDTIRTGISFVLKAKGFSTHQAKDGSECLKFIQDNDADLIILDLKMPRIDGIEVLRQIRQKQKFEDTPILIYSAHITAENSKFLEHNATDMLTKPIDLEEMLNLVELYTSSR